MLIGLGGFIQEENIVADQQDDQKTKTIRLELYQ
jgi:hypothetical protein